VVRAEHLAHESHEQKVEAVARSNHPAAMAAELGPSPAEIREAELIAATHRRY
jgi:hypothetical protein